MTDVELYREVGHRIAHARRSHAIKLSQKGLGRATGMSRETIASIETGRQRIALHQLYEIAQFLEVSVAEFLPEREEFYHPHGDVAQQVKDRPDKIKMIERLLKEEGAGGHKRVVKKTDRS